jgi:hypothetical protein
MKKTYTITVGAKSFECELEVRQLSEAEKQHLRDIGADVVPDFTYESEDISHANRQLAKVFLKEEVETLTPEKFNFLLNVVGLRGSEIAEFLAVDRAAISQWRKDTPLSKAAWTACKLLFWDVLEHGTVTLPPFLERRKQSSKADSEIVFREVKSA